MDTFACIRRKSTASIGLSLLGSLSFVMFASACVPITVLINTLAGNALGEGAEPGDVILTITRSPALGFCPYENMLHSAAVTVDDAGNYALSGSQTVTSSDPFAECLLFTFGSQEECWISVPFDNVTLTEQNAANLKRLVVSLPGQACGGFFGFTCDPCRVTRLVFSKRRERSCCFGGTEYDRVFGDIEDLLDAIAVAD